MRTLGVVELRVRVQGLSRSPPSVSWIPAQAGIQDKDRLTSRPKPRAPQPVLPAGLPSNVVSQGRKSTFSPVVTAPSLCPPTKTFEGRHPGELVSPLKDIIGAERGLMVQIMHCRMALYLIQRIDGCVILGTRNRHKIAPAKRKSTRTGMFHWIRIR